MFNPLRHIRRNGYDLDKRMYKTVVGRTKSDGSTLCGAEGTPDDHGRKNGEATVEHARSAPRLAHLLDDVCTPCVQELEAEKTGAQGRLSAADGIPLVDGTAYGSLVRRTGKGW